MPQITIKKPSRRIPVEVTIRGADGGPNVRCPALVVAVGTFTADTIDCRPVPNGDADKNHVFRRSEMEGLSLPWVTGARYNANGDVPEGESATWRHYPDDEDTQTITCDV